VAGGFVGATDNVVVGIGSLVVENNFEPGDGHVAVTTANAASLGFAFVQETPTGSGAFVSGPIGADGSGSAKFTVDATGGEALATGLYAGTPFANLDFLSYKTYKKGSSQHAVALQLDVDYDNSDNTTAFQGRVAFDIPQTSVQDDTWQTWNPLTFSTPSWFSTGTPIVGGSNQTKLCTQASPCTFAQLLGDYPNASIRPITGQSNGTPVGGGIWLKAGGNWSPSFTGNADSLTVAAHTATANGTATYDFEP
jgi:hypothetical protein